MVSSMSKCICRTEKTGTKKNSLNTNVIAKRLLAGKLLGMKTNAYSGKSGMAQFKKIFCVEPVQNQTNCRTHWDITRRAS